MLFIKACLWLSIAVENILLEVINLAYKTAKPKYTMMVIGFRMEFLKEHLSTPSFFFQEQSVNSTSRVPRFQHALNMHSIPTLRRQKQADLYEFKNSLVYRASFGTAKVVTWRNLYLKNKQTNKMLPHYFLSREKTPTYSYQFACGLVDFYHVIFKSNDVGLQKKRPNLSIYFNYEYLKIISWPFKTNKITLK